MTVQELINSSLRLIGVLAAGDTPTTAQSDQAFAALNAMIASWAESGPELAEFGALDDEIAYDGSIIRALKFNLAVEVVNEYPGFSVSVETAALAGESLAIVRRPLNAAKVPIARIDEGLLWPASRYDINLG